MTIADFGFSCEACWERDSAPHTAVRQFDGLYLCSTCWERIRRRARRAQSALTAEVAR